MERINEWVDKNNICHYVNFNKIIEVAKESKTPLPQNELKA